MGEGSSDPTALLAAVQEADVDAVARILAEDATLARATVPAHPAEKDPEGTSLLHWAMPGDGRKLNEDHVTVARLLLEAGADPNAVRNGPNHGRCVPIHLAAWGNHVPLIDLLIAHGADPNGNAGAGRSPIRTAAEHNHVDAVRALVRAGAVHSLYELLLAGLDAEVSAYLDVNPDALETGLEDGQPFLHAALTTQTGAKLVALLLDRGADPSQEDALGRTALHAAIDFQRDDEIRVLREPVEPDLMAAAGMGEASLAADLIAADPPFVSETQADGTTALFYAVLADATEIVRMLLDAGADPSPKSTRHWACLTPLHLAIMRRNEAAVDALLSGGADPDVCGNTDRYQPTPLHVAARWGGPSFVKRLLAHGADPYAGGPVGGDVDLGVLRWVAYAGQADVLSLLVDAGLDVRDARCGAVTHLAASRGKTDLVRTLLDLGVDPSQLDGEGKTALDRAEDQGQEETAAVLRG